VADLLELDDVSAGYGEAVVLDGVSLALGEGESLAVLGRNGVGKTTLLATLMGLTRLHGGRLRWRGGDLGALPPHRRAHAGLGWVPQERAIFRSLTVDENLSAVSRPGPFDAARVYRMFPRLGERRANMGDQLSGGEQQLLALGRALVLNPTLLLLDEPMEGLAPLIVEELARVIGDLARGSGLAIILVEQHARLALELTREAVVLDRGRVVHRSPSRALLDDPATLHRLVAVS
jgi:branched-chain amino acid transport system ATP-binding protein